MIRLSHPKHGFHIVYNNSAVVDHEKRGWSVHVESHVATEAEVSEEDLIRASYLYKFGKKPHHMMKIETIQKALDDNG